MKIAHTGFKGVPQGSCSGTNIVYFSKWLIFCLKKYWCLYLCRWCDINLDELLMHSEHESALAECCFESNYMKLNTDKCYLIISGNKHESFWAVIGNDRIWESNSVKLLGTNEYIEAWNLIFIGCKCVVKLTGN